MRFRKLKPAASRNCLFMLAGMIWTGVGCMLCRMAYHWLAELNRPGVFFPGAVGVLLALPVYRFGFSRIVRKNIDRLRGFPEKSCVFAFQTWRSYLLVVLMICLGIILRHLPLSRILLSVIYTTIGGGLLLASFGYYGYLFRSVFLKKV